MINNSYWHWPNTKIESEKTNIHENIWSRGRGTMKF